jgi:hypothetical protein
MRPAEKIVSHITTPDFAERNEMCIFLSGKKSEKKCGGEMGNPAGRLRCHPE